MDDQAIVDDLALVWRTIDQLCASLTEEQWDTPSECPGWTVKDLLSHMAGTELMLLKRRPPEHRPPRAGLLGNPIAEFNEVEVDYRRSWSGAHVLSEFQEATTARLVALRAMGDDDFARETPSPVGKVPYRDFMRMRTFDCWIHEQDMRRVLGRPGGLDGHIARQAVDRLAALMPYAVGKRVAPPDGTTVVFAITGDAGGVFPIEMSGGRAHPRPAEPADPAVVLRMDTEAFLCLTCGRGSAEALLKDGRIRIEGDTALGRRVVAQANVMI